MLSLFESDSKSLIPLLDFLYSSLNLEELLSIESQVMKNPDIFDYNSEYLNFTSQMKKQRAANFLPKSTFTDWMKLNFISKLRIIPFLIENKQWIELGYFLSDEYNLKSNEHQFQFLNSKCDISEQDYNSICNPNITSCHNFYVVQFKGHVFPAALKISPFIYKSVEILSGIIEQIQASFPDSLINHLP